MDSLEALQRLTDAVETAGADIAPTYQEYMPLAFAVANSCGEAGRSLFHRLCRLSAKYRQAEADRLYDQAPKGGRTGERGGLAERMERGGYFYPLFTRAQQ